MNTPENQTENQTENVQTELPIETDQPIETDNEPVSDTAPAPDPEFDDAAPWGRKADGTPRRKPGRRGAGETGPDPATVGRLNSVGSPPPRKARPTPAENQPPAPPPIAVDYDNVGKIAATVFFNAGVAILGPEWEPDVDKGEPQQIAGAFSKYFESVQMVDISPGWALAITLGMYGVKRFDKPSIRQRIKGVVSLIKSRLPFGR